jgi:IS5 family transposase
VTPNGATRRVSLHDPDARPIAKGRLGKPVEFGHKAQLADNEDGIVLDYTVEQGNPADAPQLAPAVERITRRTGRAPRAVTADRGYGEQKVDDALRELGVRTVVIPRKGKSARPDRPRNTDQRSEKPSSGEPASKAESAPSNADMAGTAPASTAPKEPESGQATEP